MLRASHGSRLLLVAALPPGLLTPPTPACPRLARPQWSSNCPNKAAGGGGGYGGAGGGGGGINADFPAEVPCGTCGAPCPQRTSNSEKNPGRVYFKCPSQASSLRLTAGRGWSPRTWPPVPLLRTRFA